MTLLHIELRAFKGSPFKERKHDIPFTEDKGLSRVLPLGTEKMTPLYIEPRAFKGSPSRDRKDDIPLHREPKAFKRCLFRD